jgi:hypothetical protein
MGVAQLEEFVRQYLEDDERIVTTVETKESTRSFHRGRRLGVAVTDRRVLLVRYEQQLTQGRHAPYQPSELLAAPPRSEVEVVSFAREYVMRGQYGPSTYPAVIKLRFHGKTLKLNAPDQDIEADRVANALTRFNASRLDVASTRRRRIRWAVFFAALIVIVGGLWAGGLYDSEEEKSHDGGTQTGTISQEDLTHLFTQEELDRLFPQGVPFTIGQVSPTTTTTGRR